MIFAIGAGIAFVAVIVIVLYVFICMGAHAQGGEPADWLVTCASYAFVALLIGLALMALSALMYAARFMP